MSFPSRVDSIYANEIACTPVDSANFNIVNTNGGEILLNGVNPAGGGASLPITGIGNITVTGNIRAQGDGITTGQLEGEIIKATSGNIIASAGNIEVLAGNVEISGTGGLEINGSGKIKATSGNVEVLAGNVEISGTGSLDVKGTGEVKTTGGGNITAGLSGDVQTTTGDIVSGNKIFFDGDDIYHRTNNPAAETSYVTYKQLPQLGANNTFTGANKFDDNVNEFSEKVSVGERDAGGLFTQKTAINPSGNIECVSLNNGTAITCGTITCDNGGTNSCAAKTFTTRTSGTAGWVIEQQTAQGNALDNVLQIKGGQAGGYITIVNSAFAGFVPNIVFDPQTEAEGGKIVTDNYTIGDSNPNMFAIKQPKTGVDSNNLIIQGSALDGSIKFQNNAGTTDLVKIESDSTDGSGRIYCPALFFGTTGIHNSIVNDIAGPESLVLKIRQATASSEVVFLDNADAEIIRIQKTQVELGNTIPLLFGAYSFRPIQYTYSKSITIRDTPDTTNYTNMIFNALGTPTQPTLGGKNLWTRVNDGQTGVSLYDNTLEGFYKCSIKQTGDSSSANFRGTEIIFDYILAASIQDTPDLTPPISYGYNRFPADRAGTPPLSTAASVLIDHRNQLSSQSQPVFLNFSDPPAVGETMPILVTLTKLDF